MKKHLFAPAILAILLPSCQSERQDLAGAGVVPPEIVAEVESQPDTRTVLTVDQEGTGTIWWKPADQISIFFGSANARYVSQNFTNATSAIFRTDDIIGSTESASSDILGLYPFDPAATSDGSTVTTTLPADQYGLPETFDDDLFIALAQSPTNSLKFYNVCGGIKFSLSRDDITSVIFKGNNNEDLAGDISVAFVDGLPSATVVGGQKRITVTPKTGNTFAQGVNYYLIALPVTLSQGFTMTFTTTSGSVGTFRYTAKPVTIKRSVFGKKADIDTYATFQNPISRVLFLGNSITLHPKNEYWWGAWGMAASRPEYDYVHRVMAKLREFVPSATYNTSAIGGWEVNPDFTSIAAPNVYAPNALRAEGLPYSDTDLIVIRLGENVRDDTHFEVALTSLVNYLKLEEVAPNARIVITGQYWTNAFREAACYNAAVATGSTFVQINQFDTPAYKERVGNYVYGDDNQLHMINNTGVAEHPSDAGMLGIAEAILNGVFPNSL